MALPRCACALAVLSALMVGCGSLRWDTDARGFDPGRVLVALEQQAEGTAAQARAVLRSVREARQAYGADLVREQIACYQGVLVSGCLEGVAARERQLDARLNGIEVKANQRLRDLSAIERSEREAQGIEARRTQEDAQLASEASNRERYAQRQREAQEAEAERQAQAPELLRREQAQRERQLERERAFEQRQKAGSAAPPRQ
ncbi:MAG: hypothetical protein RLZ51_2344 [Pseudomonadota bacterium]